MPSTAFAPATTGNRVIVGPTFTAFGFKCWYLVCFQDAIFAVRQSFPKTVALAYSTDTPPKLYGYKRLIWDLMTAPGRRLRRQIPPSLQTIPDSQLRSTPNVVIPTSQVRSFILKSGNLARYSAPEISLELNTGKKLIYGIWTGDFERVCGQLWQMYPQLCK